MFLSQKDSNETDETLLNAFRQGADQRILGTLFARYSALVYGVSLKYLKNRDDAKDAVMQIFEKLPKNIREHTIQHFKSWLYVTSRNHCLMKLRSEKGRHAQEITDDLMELPLVLHLEDERNPIEADLQKLEKCIEELKDEQKHCIQLFYLKEQCYKEIASKTGLEINKVKSHIQNGKRNLKICIEQGE